MAFKTIRQLPAIPAAEHTLEITEEDFLIISNAIDGGSTYKISVKQLNDVLPVFTPSTATTTGIKGLVPAPQKGDLDEYLTSSGDWDIIPLNTQTKSGIVLAPESATSVTQKNYSNALKSWSTDAEGKPDWRSWVDTIDVFTAPTATLDGKKGLVPAPGKGEGKEILRADGQWVLARDMVSSVTVSDTAPTDPVPKNGDLWFDTENESLFVYVETASSWVECFSAPDISLATQTSDGLMSSSDKLKLDNLGGSVTTSTSAPSGSDGDLWFNESTGELFVYVNTDGWFQANGVSGGGSGGGSGASWSSGWVSSDGTNSVDDDAELTFSHNLGTTNITATVWASQNTNGSNAVYVSSIDRFNPSPPYYNFGSFVQIVDSNQIKLLLGSQGFLAPNKGGSPNGAQKHYGSESGQYPYINVVVTSGTGGTGGSSGGSSTTTSGLSIVAKGLAVGSSGGGWSLSHSSGCTITGSGQSGFYINVTSGTSDAVITLGYGSDKVTSIQREDSNNRFKINTNTGSPQQVYFMVASGSSGGGSGSYGYQLIRFSGRESLGIVSGPQYINGYNTYKYKEPVYYIIDISTGEIAHTVGGAIYDQNTQGQAQPDGSNSSYTVLGDAGVIAEASRLIRELNGN